eukprot:jgi/Chlat1/2112/Chrsp17S02838
MAGTAAAAVTALGWGGPSLAARRLAFGAAAVVVRTPDRRRCPPRLRGNRWVATVATAAPTQIAAQPKLLPMRTVFYADHALRRESILREDADWMSSAMSSSTSLVVPIWKGKNLVTKGDRLQAILLQAGKLPVQLAQLRPIFLGLSADNTPLFAVDFEASPGQDQDYSLARQGLTPEELGGNDAQLADLRSAGPQLPFVDAALLAYARGMTEWQRNQDPAVIMRVSSSDYVLLGHQGRWADGQIGETMEMSVVREVSEEANVVVDPDSVRYHSSQPWPFPSSLMVGFTASAVADASSPSTPPPPKPDGKELQDVRWFHKDWLRTALTRRNADFSLLFGRPFSMPAPFSVSRVLIDEWLAEGQPAKDDLFQQLDPFVIDEGIFKYIAVVIKDHLGRERVIVRGSSNAEYHQDILNAFNKERQEFGLISIEVTPLGGGRMDHDADAGELKIYGFSYAFGQADHSIAAKLARKWLPFHTSVTTSDEGY